MSYMSMKNFLEDEVSEWLGGLSIIDLERLREELRKNPLDLDDLIGKEIREHEIFVASNSGGL